MEIFKHGISIPDTVFYGECPYCLAILTTDADFIRKHREDFKTYFNGFLYSGACMDCKEPNSFAQIIFYPKGSSQANNVLSLFEQEDTNA